MVRVSLLIKLIFKGNVGFGAKAAAIESMVQMESKGMSSVSSVRKERVASHRKTMRIGFVGLADAAPLFVAQELGLFEQHGLDVVISREVGWASVREKVVCGELDASHAISPLPFSSCLGINTTPTPCLSGLVLSRGGNAIVLSTELWKRGVRDRATLKLDIENRRAFRRHIFASVFSCSTHTIILRKWLSEGGIDPDRDVQIVTLPPSQMSRSLGAGTIDGFCVGEPWASMAIANKSGWSPASSVDICQSHPEKALMVTQAFAERRAEEHTELIAALIEACAVCEDPRFRKAIARLLSDRRRVNCSAHLLELCLAPRFNYGMGREEACSGFVRFYSGDANRPSLTDAKWILDGMQACGVAVSSYDREDLLSRVLRDDIFDRASKRVDVASARRKAELRLT